MMQYELGYGLTVYEMLKKAKETFGNQNLFSYMRNGQIVTVSYEEFWVDVHNVAYRLEQKQVKGRYVIIEGKPVYETIVALYATITVGAIAAMVNMDLPEEEICRAMKLMNPAMVICSEDAYDVVEEYTKSHNISCVFCAEEDAQMSIRQWINEGGTLYEYTGEQKAEDPALVLMTSGSTSQSKVVLLSHYAFVPNKEYYADKNILLFPLYHIAGLSLVSNCIVKGVKLCLSNMKEGMRDIEWFKPTEMVSVPAFISVMVERSKKNQFDLSNFKSITSAGAPQNLALTEYLNSFGIFSGSSYGATETGGPVIYTTPMDYRYGAVGKPGPWNEVKISDIGEVLVRGKNIMLEYIGNPEETKEVLADGWYHTGDAGHIDEDGFLCITGRIKNIIILSNGENVSPEAIEKQLNYCEEIEEVIVYGEDDVIAAHVWCGENADDSTKEKVEKYIAKYNRTVPSYHCVRKIVFRETPFDKTSTGKVKR